MDLIPPPLVFAGVVSGVYAGIFHLIVRRRTLHLLLYWVAAMVGFGIGQLASSLHSLNLYTIGPIHIVEGTIGAWVVMSIVSWLEV